MNIVSMETLAAIFTQALLEVVSKISGFELDVISQESDPGFDETIAVMSLNSSKSGMVFLSADEACMRILCSFMVGVPEENISKTDIEDVLCELVNMTAGNAKLRLVDTEYMFALSSPFIMSGTGITISAKKRVNVISRQLGNAEISLRLKVVY